MPLNYIASALWAWVATTGITLALLITAAFLVPRAGRLVMRIIERKVLAEDTDESKAYLAIAGVAIYVSQIIAYFLIFAFILQALGFSLSSAALPATAASAAIALGAQSIVADFLAGFFILTEKQYGVGDWVRFEGGKTTAEGTVIQITMRATRIRTLAEETVTIPNSSAGVSINNSNYWSSAVVVMPIPLLGSHSIYDAIERSTRAAQRALTKKEIASEILGELSVHESTAITAPSTVGMPWTVNIRFICQVKPGSQWRVERAIRTSIIDEFWPQYGSIPTATGLPEPGSQFLDSVNHDMSRRLTSDPAHTPSTWPDHTQADKTDANKLTRSIKKHNDQAQAKSTIVAQAATETEPQVVTLPSSDAQDPARKHEAHNDPAATQPRFTANQEKNDQDHTKPAVSTEQSTWHKMLTLGGRMRASTAVLLLIFGVLIILRGLTFETNHADTNGVLAPAPQNQVVSPTSVPPTSPVIETTQAPSTSEIIPEESLVSTPVLTTEPNTAEESTDSNVSIEETPIESAAPTTDHNTDATQSPQEPDNPQVQNPTQ
ncbi:small-conductance mechanosensitive channel [Corynebacterium kutscheri]|uniref:Small-conductance mechanosensitive channel n=1 Tax=Corynebacterium kutscheri TaxID=35755 RepID=A0A0F6R1H3_9CORY|nr:mechanosensitive ion channel family protein [Corynebacterium kutscheri]AKE41033.1 small-conductance mechanosensitive channel [Corynebacterium kutscheri]VEH06922.1 Small-conductance mechanosensitive channel [Corynebacterium kutscheri]VEH09331.1 Small-conductance mechanosensitive channel [Corynebacterium kutscheri]